MFSSLADLRSRHPDAFDGMSDTELLARLAQRRGVSVEAEAAARGLNPRQYRQSEGLIGDTFRDLAVGASQIPQDLAGLADLQVQMQGLSDYVPSVLDAANRAYDAVGLTDWQERQQHRYSPARMEQTQAVDDAFRDGTWEGVKAVAANPRHAVGLAAQSIPGSLAGGGIGRAALTGIQRAAPRLAQRAATPYIATGFGQGAYSAGAQYRNLMDQDADPDKAVRAALGTGAVVGVTSGLGGAAAHRLGARDLDYLATAGRSPGGAASSAAQRLGVGVVNEVMQEIPQSASQQALSNYALDRPLTENLGRATVEGAFAGGYTGAGTNILPSGQRATDIPGDSTDSPSISYPDDPGMPPLHGEGLEMRTPSTGIEQETTPPRPESDYVRHLRSQIESANAALHETESADEARQLKDSIKRLQRLLDFDLATHNLRPPTEQEMQAFAPLMERRDQLQTLLEQSEDAPNDPRVRAYKSALKDLNELILSEQRRTGVRIDPTVDLTPAETITEPTVPSEPTQTIAEGEGLDLPIAPEDVDALIAAAPYFDETTGQFIDPSPDSVAPSPTTEEATGLTADPVAPSPTAEEATGLTADPVAPSPTTEEATGLTADPAGSAPSVDPAVTQLQEQERARLHQAADQNTLALPILDRIRSELTEIGESHPDLANEISGRLSRPSELETWVRIVSEYTPEQRADLEARVEGDPSIAAHIDRIILDETRAPLTSETPTAKKQAPSARGSALAPGLRHKPKETANVTPTAPIESIEDGAERIRQKFSEYAHERIGKINEKSQVQFSPAVTPEIVSNKFADAARAYMESLSDSRGHGERGQGLRRLAESLQPYLQNAKTGKPPSHTHVKDMLQDIVTRAQDDAELANIAEQMTLLRGSQATESRTDIAKQHIQEHTDQADAHPDASVLHEERVQDQADADDAGDGEVTSAPKTVAMDGVDLTITRDIRDTSESSAKKQETAHAIFARAANKLRRQNPDVFPEDTSESGVDSTAQALIDIERYAPEEYDALLLYTDHYKDADEVGKNQVVEALQPWVRHAVNEARQRKTEEAAAQEQVTNYLRHRLGDSVVDEGGALKPAYARFLENARRLTPDERMQARAALNPNQGDDHVAKLEILNAVAATSPELTVDTTAPTDPASATESDPSEGASQADIVAAFNSMDFGRDTPFDALPRSIRSNLIDHVRESGARDSDQIRTSIRGFLGIPGGDDGTDTGLSSRHAADSPEAKGPLAPRDTRAGREEGKTGGDVRAPADRPRGTQPGLEGDRGTRRADQQAQTSEATPAPKRSAPIEITPEIADALQSRLVNKFDAKRVTNEKGKLNKGIQAYIEDVRRKTPEERAQLLQELGPNPQKASAIKAEILTALSDVESQPTVDRTPQQEQPQAQAQPQPQPQPQEQTKAPKGQKLKQRAQTKKQQENIPRPDNNVLRLWHNAVNFAPPSTPIDKAVGRWNEAPSTAREFFLERVNRKNQEDKGWNVRSSAKDYAERFVKSTWNEAMEYADMFPDTRNVAPTPTAAKQTPAPAPEQATPTAAKQTPAPAPEQATPTADAQPAADLLTDVPRAKSRAPAPTPPAAKETPAQIHREADGFGVDDARALDAELNIRDGQGKAIDYVDYFKAKGLTRSEAEQEGYLARNPGKRAFEIASSAGDAVVSQLRAGKLSDVQAAAISAAAPNNEAMQAFGVKQITQRRLNEERAVAMMDAMRAVHEERQQDAAFADSQGDMFGFDDAATNQAEQMAAVVADHRRSLTDRITALQGVNRHPEIAKQEGISVDNPAQIAQRLDELKAERKAWENWPTNPEIRAEVQRRAKNPRYSRATTAGGSSRLAVEDTIAQVMGGTRSDLVHVYQSADEAIAAGVAPEDAKTAKGWVTRGKDGRWHAHLIADHIKPGREMGVFMHEVGSHLGLDALLDQNDLSRLGLQIKRWAIRNDGSLESTLARRALDRVKYAQRHGDNRDFGTATSERLAYFIEEAINEGVSPTALKSTSPLGRFLNQLVNAFRRAYNKLGFGDASNLTAQDIVDLAHGAAHIALQEGAPQQRTTKQAASFSRSAIPTNKVLSEWHDALVSGGQTAIINSGEAARNVAFGMMTVNQLADEFGTTVPAMRDFDRATTALEADVKRYERAAADIGGAWANLSKRVAKTHDELLSRARRLEYDPSRQHTPDTLATLTPEQDQLQREFDALPQEAKEVFARVTEHYRQQAKKINALLKEMQRDIDPSNVEAIEAINNALVRAKDPYVPFMRLGGHFAIGRSRELADLEARYEADPDSLTKAERKMRAKMRASEDHYYIRGYSSAGKARVEAEKLRSRYAVVDARSARHANEALSLQSFPEFETLRSELSKRIPKEMIGQVEQSLQQVLFNSLPENHALKRRLRSEDIYGEEPNKRVAFEVEAKATARYMAKLKHARAVGDALDGLRRASDGYGKDFERALYNTVAAKMDMQGLKEHSPILSGLTNASYMAHLGASPGYLAINATQVPMVTIPWLGARVGYGNAVKQLGTALGDMAKLLTIERRGSAWIARLNWDKAEREGILSNDELSLLRDYLTDRNLMDVTVGHDLNASALGAVPHLNNMMQTVNMPVHALELLNRGITGLAAYRGAKASGRAGSRRDFAAEAVQNTQVNYAALNLPRYMEAPFGIKAAAPLGRMIFQFWRFRQAMLYLTFSSAIHAAKGDAEARRTLFGLMGSTALSAGVMEMPLAGAFIWLAAQAIGADEDDYSDVPTAIRNWFHDIDPTLGEVASKGVFSLAGVDVSQRIGWGQLHNPTSFARFGRTPDPKDDVKEAVFSLLGAPASYAGDLWSGAVSAANGDWMDAAQKITPVKGIRDVLRGIDLAENGVATRNGTPVFRPDDLSAGDIWLRALGLQSSKMGNYHDAMSAVYRRRDAVIGKREELIQRAYTARQRGRWRELQQVRQEIRQFNTRHRDRSLRITPDTLRRSLAQRDKVYRERHPSGVRGGMQMAPFLDTARFATPR